MSTWRSARCACSSTVTTSFVEIASESFADLNVALAADGLPVLLPAKQAKQAAAASGVNQVGIFGAKPWSGEITLPPAVPGAGRYKVDFTAVVVALVAICCASLQWRSSRLTPQTTHEPSMTGPSKRTGVSIVQSGVGFNWENVSKRILPQLIIKGLILQGEGLVQRGIYFVTPEPVFQRIMTQARRAGTFPTDTSAAGTITFVRCNMTQYRR